MIERIKHFIKRNKLFNTSDHIIVGVSGGADSIALLTLLKKLNYNITAAHCNFNLRPIDCDQDQILVKNYCNHISVPLHCISFNTEKKAKDEKISIEMAARDLRYAWFEKLRTEIKADYIATGHHSDDNAETALQNIIRGTGLLGLTAIKQKNNYIVRPLLFASRNEIETWLEINDIPFCTDKSNTDTSIPRNRIRHNIIPEIEKINPSFSKTMQMNIQAWNDWYQFANNALETAINQHVKYFKDSIQIDLTHIPEKATRRLMLFHVLINLGIKNSEAADLLSVTESQVGTQAQNDRFDLIKGRNCISIKIKTIKPTIDKEITISELPCKLGHPYNVAIRKASIDKVQISLSSKQIEVIDIANVTFPLTIRRWSNGDRFSPLGMKGTKKVSDYLTNLKLEPLRKQEQYVLCDSKSIIWLIGLRLSSEYAITSQTSQVLVLEQLEE